MKELTVQEISEVSGAQLTCSDEWEIGGGIAGALLGGGWPGAAAGITIGGLASYAFCS